MNLRRVLPLILVLVLCLPLLVGADRGSKKERSQARGELGRAYLSEGSVELAIGALSDAVDLDKSNWAAWTFLGLALAEKGDDDGAEEAFGKALKLADDRAEPHFNYGLFLYGQERYDEAIVQYELALKDLTYRKPAFILNNMGFALLAKGDHDRAVDVLREAVMRAPNLCPARFNLGLALQGAGETDDAVRAYADVIETCGEDAPGAYLQVARLEIDRGRPQEAVPNLIRVIELAPDTDASEAAQELLIELER